MSHIVNPIYQNKKISKGVDRINESKLAFILDPLCEGQRNKILGLTQIQLQVLAARCEEAKGYIHDPEAPLPIVKRNASVFRHLALLMAKRADYLHEIT